MKSIIMRITLFTVFLFSFSSLPGYSATERRTAVVIGNGAYETGRLKNPVNDATDMAATLKRMGFNVILKINASQKEIDGAEQASVPAGEFKAHKTISNVLMIKADSRKIQAMETTVKETQAMPPTLVKPSTPAPDLCRTVVAEKRFKRDAVLWSEKSEKMSDTKNWSEMIRMASVAIEIDPCYPDAYINRSWGYIEKGFFDEALSDCQKALSLDKRNASAFNNRGLLYLKTGKSEMAKGDFGVACDEGLEVGCNNFKLITGYKPNEKIEFFLNKANESFKNKDWESVIKNTSNIFPNDTALAVRCGAYAYKGMLEEAIKDCDTAIRINPDSALAYNNKGFSLELMGKKGEALLNYEFACNLKLPLGCDNMNRLSSIK
jgi:hypothetical protein